MTNSLSQISGGDVFVEQLNSTQYSILVKLIAACNDTNISDSIGVSPISSQARIFDSMNDTLVTSFTSGMADSIVNVKYGDSCYIPSGLCSKAYYYSTVVTLSNSVSKFYLTWKINNLYSTTNVSAANSFVLYAEFSVDISTIKNSLPKFDQIVSKGYGCIGYEFPLNFSCSEPDGDSLVYSIVNPISGFSSIGSKPLSTNSYTQGKSQPLGLGSFCQINSSTGMVTARIAQLGLFSIAVKCEEFRGGTKISEVVKEYMFAGLNCRYGLPINFKSFPESYEFEYGKLNCFDVVARSTVSNEDPIFLRIQTDMKKHGLVSGLPIENEDGTYNFKWISPILGFDDTVNNLTVNQLSEYYFQGVGRVGTKICWDLRGCDKFPYKEYTVNLQATVDRCGIKDTMNQEVKINLINKEKASPYSQVLTPNGDGVNDVFRLPVNENNECLKFEQAIVFNTNGQRVFESTNSNLIWNGTDFLGKKVSAGVYLVQISGKYGEQNHTESFKLLLIR